jgi:hypothetical protein
MNILRKLKLHIINESNNDEIARIFDFFSDLLKNIVLKTDLNNYPGKKFYFYNNKIFIVIDGENNTQVAYIGFVSILNKNFKIDYNDLKNVIRFFLERYFKIKINDIKLGLGVNRSVYDKHFSNEF